MSKTTTVRVPTHTRDRAARIAREAGTSVSAVIEEALDRYDEDRFWDDFDAAVERHRADHAAWDAETSERTRWDRATTRAGLDPE